MVNYNGGKMNIKRLIPLKIKQKIIQYISRNDIYKDYKKKDKKIVLALAADYGNLGDVAITYAQRKFLEEKFPDYEVIEIPISETYKNMKSLKRVIGKDDVITIIGGGNFGNLYQEIEDMRQAFIKTFKKNTVVCFPQTIDFSEDKLGNKKLKKAKEVYKRNKKLVLFARENKSFNVMKKNFKLNNIYLAPDIVLSLNKKEPKLKRENITICFRNDNENKINKTRKQEIIDLLTLKYKELLYFKDTHVGKVSITENEREKYLSEIWNTFKKSKVVLTDRLHGMIFCVITGTPCIVFPNSNGKIESTYYTWLKNYKNIKLISEDFSNEDIINNIEYFLKNENIEDNVINFDIKYKKIEEVIRESKQ